MMVMRTLTKIGELDSRCFFLKQGKRLSNLKDFTHKIEHFVQGLDMLSTGQLSQTLIHPRRLLTLLRKVVRDVTMKNSQFLPLYTELSHYYETHSVSFNNTEEYLIIQIPIFFVKQQTSTNGFVQASYSSCSFRQGYI